MTKSRVLRLAFRLNQDEHDLITWAARVRGQSISEYVRTTALDRAGVALVEIESSFQPKESAS